LDPKFDKKLDMNNQNITITKTDLKPTLKIIKHYPTTMVNFMKIIVK
jgi:hypothetical protein